MAAVDNLVTAYLALGSNKGDREEILFSTLSEIAKTVQLTKISPLYETPHVGPAAPDHLNCAVEIRTALSPEELIDICHSVEAKFGRDREHEIRWGARTIDIDIALYGDLSRETGRVILPHPRMMHRRFVLEPLAQIAPSALIPGFDIRVSEVLEWPSVMEQKVTQISWSRPIAELLG